MNENNKIELILEGLNCANCAQKIETKVNKINEVNEAAFNFVTKTLSIELNDIEKAEFVIFQVRSIVSKYEPDVIVKEKDMNKSSQKDTDIQDNSEQSNKKELIRLVIGAVIFGVAIAFNFSFKTEFVLFFISYLLIGGEIILRAGKNILRGQVFDENFLMSMATIGAFAVGEFPEGVAVMLFYQIGERFQDLAVNRSRKSITALMDFRPDYANLKINEVIEQVSPEEVNIGDIVVIKPGEKVPLDGKVIEGKSMVDTSALTGESVPRKVEPGQNILGGFINQNGLLTVEVTKTFGDSTVSKILDLVENASSRKAPTEQFITKFSRYYTPVVVFSALALAVIPPLLINGAAFSEWLYRALIFLVISCPCALVVSIPLGFFGGIGGASKNGILVKGGNYLEALNDVDIAIFDKTGTLTKGVFKVTDRVSMGYVTEDELIEYAAYAESYSNHPIAASILKAYGKEVDKNKVDNYDEISGYGIKVNLKDRQVLAGNAKLMTKENIKCDEVDAAGTIVYIAIDSVYAGYIVISDEIKQDAKGAIEMLKDMGVRKTVMLTGDRKSVGDKIAKELGLDEVYAELLPDQKVEKLEILDKQKRPKGKVVFVGDGINDAPVLARADIGIAMGGLGSDAAIEAADVVLMTDEPSKLVKSIKIARRTRRIVLQNLVFALGIKGFVLLLGASGIATMWEAVFADVGVSLLAVLNSLRALSVNNL